MNPFQRSSSHLPHGTLLEFCLYNAEYKTKMTVRKNILLCFLCWRERRKESETYIWNALIGNGRLKTRYPNFVVFDPQVFYILDT